MRRLERQMLGLGMVMLAGLFFIEGFGITLNINPLSFLNPGFEGAKVYNHGISFDGWSWSSHKLHLVNEGTSGQILESRQGTLPNDYQSISWIALGASNCIAEFYNKEYDDHLQLQIETQSSIPLQYIDEHGDPSGWNETYPNDVRLLEWWTYKKVEQNGEVQWQVEKESVMLVPADFVIIFSIPPMSGSRHASGWTEGDWLNTNVWFRFEWVNWLNVAKPYLQNDPNPPTGTPPTAEKIYEYRGGFPITAWVSGWDVIKPARPGESKVNFPWSILFSKEKEAEITYENLIDLYPDLENGIKSKTSMTPSVEGHFIDLYSEPSWQYSLNLPTNENVAEQQYANPRVPDPGFAYTQYFPITLQDLGVVVKGSLWTSWDLFYPYVYMRLRVIYGVYGHFTYLWTESSSTQPPINYPGFQNGSSTIIHVDSPFKGAFDILYNPFFWLGLGSFILLIAVIVWAPWLLVLGGKCVVRLVSVSRKRR